MSGTLVAVVSGLAALLVVLAVVTVARDGRVGRVHLVAAAVVELAVLVFVVAGFVDIARGVRPLELATAVAYLVVAPFVLPAGTFWTLAERSRPSTLVLVVAAFAVVVIAYRTFVLFSVTR